MSVDGENMENRGSNAKVENFTIDVGSTEIRVLNYNPETFDSKLDVIPSCYGILSSDISHVSSESKGLDDNLEIIIEDITEGKMTKKFNTLRVLKGALLETLKLEEERISSSSGKRDQVEFYANIIMGLGYGIVKKRRNSLEFEQVFIPDLTLAVRPEDSMTQKRIDQILDTLRGTYRFELPRLKISIIIEIKRNSIFIEDESQANLRYYIMEKGDDSKCTTLVIDFGGTSSDVALVENGVLVKGFSKTIPLAGEKIRAIFKELIIDEYDLDISDRNAESALRTGELKDGNKVIDVLKLISKSRKKFGQIVFNSLKSLFGEKAYSLRGIDEIIVVGRPCTSLSGTVSLANVIEKYYQTASPNTTVGRVKIDYPIVYGLMYFRINLLKGTK